MGGALGTIAFTAGGAFGARNEWFSLAHFWGFDRVSFVGLGSFLNDGVSIEIVVILLGLT